jgi:PPOX class probable F420-dependent enzyme
MALDPSLLALFTEIGGGTLITLKRDGRPQASVVGHLFDPATREVRISVTDSRAKTRNLRRDPRVSYEVVRPDRSAYAVGEGTARLSPVAADPHDAVADDLVAYYRDIAGEHPDWEEYRRAMVDEGRLVLRFTLDHVYGWARP